MKTKLLTLLLFGLLTFGFVSCAEEEIAPSNEISKTNDRIPVGGVPIRD